MRPKLSRPTSHSSTSREAGGRIPRLGCRGKCQNLPRAPGMPVADSLERNLAAVNRAQRRGIGTPRGICPPDGPNGVAETRGSEHEPGDRSDGKLAPAHRVAGLARCDRSRVGDWLSDSEPVLEEAHRRVEHGNKGGTTSIAFDHDWFSPDGSTSSSNVAADVFRVLRRTRLERISVQPPLVRKSTNTRESGQFKGKFAAILGQEASKGTSES